MTETRSFKERFVEKATNEPRLAKKLREMAELESRAISGTRSGGMTAGSIDDMLARAQSGAGAAQTQRLLALYDEVAKMVAEAGESTDDLSDWISYHYQEVLREVAGRKPWWKFF
jgi:Mg2+ and Co2+ transporter CorA